MKRKDAEDVEPAESATGEAARWFVRVDAGEPGADAELARWLAARPENEGAFERVELAVALGRRLAADTANALHAEAASATRTLRRRTRNPALALGGALAAGLLVAAFVMRGDAPPPAPEPVPMQAALLVALGAPSDPVAVLPNGVVVDASAVAVLPFVSAGDPTLAEGLERDLVAALRSVPGLYVVADSAARSYAYTDLSPAEIGTQLGARGIVDAGVELAEGRVRVIARLREAATGATVWQAYVDRPVDELHAVRQALAEQIAASILDSGLRADVARLSSSSAGFAASKPLPQ